MTSPKIRNPIYDQNGPNQLKPVPYLWKTMPFGAVHAYIAHIREYESQTSLELRYELSSSQDIIHRS